MIQKPDYVSVVYNQKERPLTDYPDKLTRYLFDRYNMREGQKILDCGCGRGEFLKGFMSCGMNGFGADASLSAKEICPAADIRCVDFENGLLPYEDDFFDVIFSKSVLEHFYYPEKLIKEMFRVLKPGGLVVTMVPDWEAVYKTFYEDYTHRTPFTVTSLRDIHLIHGFINVQSTKFLQLPALWRFPWLKSVSRLVGILMPDVLKPHSKFIRFSKEVMLLSSANKPVRQ